MSYTRGHDAATLYDEASKGLEVLRQQRIDITSNGTYVAFVAEVDTLLRYVNVVSNMDVHKGTITVQRRRGEDNIIAMSDAFEMETEDAFTPRDIPLNDLRVLQGDCVVIQVASKSPNNVRLTVSVGWMPDFLGESGMYHTYTMA